LNASEYYQNTPRLYIGSLSESRKSQNALIKDQIITLSPDQSHYLTKVLRIFSNREENPRVRLFDGVSGEWIAQVIPLDQSNEMKGNKSRKRNYPSIQAKCLFQSRKMPVESSANTNTCWLFFAPIKMQRIKILIEKGTELGCDAFVPVHSDHTENSSLMSLTRDIVDRIASEGVKGVDKIKNLEELSLYNNNYASSSPSSSEKLSLIAIEASEQSERLQVPYIALNLLQITHEMNKETEQRKDRYTIWSILKVLEIWTDPSQLIDDRVLLICRERSSSVPLLTEAFDKMHKIGKVKIAFLVGPEGGWSIQEEHLFDRFSYEFPQNIMCVSLGSSILRAETASILAIGSYVLWRETRLLN